VPFKANADRRHRIPRQRFKVTNWRAYDAGLRGRGSLTVWFTAVASATAETAPTQRDRHLRDIAEHGRMAW
jgi:hypothetical protein